LGGYVKIPNWRVVLLGAPFLFACSLLSNAVETTQPTRQIAAATGTPSEALPTKAPTPTPADAGMADPEAIWIRQPGPTSRLTSPLLVEGQADATFENHLGLSLISMEGEILAETNTSIEAPIGRGGAFAVEMTFMVTEDRPALLQVFANSARDGGTTHLASVPITLLATGTSQIEPPPSLAETIQIHTPGAGETVSGGSVTVVGFGWASFESNLVVEVLGPDRDQLAKSPVTVAAPDTGQPGEFQLELTYEIEGPAPGRIVVWDPSPAFGGPVHLASVEVQLAP
jgi:hypothetical protein